MRLTQIWTPPRGLTRSSTTFKNERIHARVYGGIQRIGEEDQDVVRYGFWCVNPETGRERFVDAPFFKKGTLRGQLERRPWRIRGVEDGVVVVTLGVQMSYDIAYYVFTYDGMNWHQVEPFESPYRVQEFVLKDCTLRKWDGPGLLDCQSFALAGGELLSIPEPMRFAVDNTHAFAYDSGPDSPRSEPYLRALEILESMPSSRYEVDSDTQNAVFEAIPKTIRDGQDKGFWGRAMSPSGESVWLSEWSYAEACVIRVMHFSE